MGRLVLKRLLGLPPLLLAVSLLAYALLNASGADAFQDRLGSPRVSEAQVQQLRSLNGLNRSLPRRYLSWLGGLVRGDAGRSLRYGLPVSDLVLPALGWTLLLALTGLGLAWGLGLPTGLLAARASGGALDTLLGLLGDLSQSTPRLLLALLALVVAARTAWFPIGGVTPGAEARALVLPALVLGLTGFGPVSLRFRRSLLDAMSQPWFRAGRSRGLSPARLWLVYTPRAAAPAMIALLGNQLAALLSTAFLVEVVFAWPGLARLTLEALQGRDEALVMASVMLAALALLTANLVTDLVLAGLDPRLRPA